MTVGGPVFVLLMVGLGAAGYREFLGLAACVNPGGTGTYARAGYAVVAALACAAYVDETTASLLPITVLAVVLPLVLFFPRCNDCCRGRLGWSLACAGSLYVGLPVYAAVATRSISGTIDAPWLIESARRVSIAWEPDPVAWRGSLP